MGLQNALPYTNSKMAGEKNLQGTELEHFHLRQCRHKGLLRPSTLCPLHQRY